MRKFISVWLVLLISSAYVFAQTSRSELKTIELFARMNSEGKSNPLNFRASCFNFISEEFSCKDADLYFQGIILRKIYSDLFQAAGVGSRNKIKKLGRKNWTDDFKISVIKPYAKLKPGEQRTIVWDVSGEDGKDGAPGFSGNRMSNADDFNDIGTVRGASEIVRRRPAKSDYHPYELVVEGNMYVMRVVNDTDDFYVLFRVDELEKGKRCKISWKKIDAPKEK